MTIRTLVAASALLLNLSAGALAASIVVTDGDSLDIDGKHVEIWGIIAPQKSEVCRTQAGKSWPCGEIAYKQLSEAVADPDIDCEEKEPGFVLCRAGGLDIGLLMVKEGLARARQDYSDIEARAREAKVGIWE